MEPTKELIQKELRNVGLKATPSRVAVLSVLYASQEPIDAQKILESFSVADAPDQATVYRILRSLVLAGLVHELLLAKGSASYEVADRPHHHHLICEKCGFVEDVPTCCEDPKPRAKSFKQVVSHNLEFSGICNACAG